MAAWFRRAIIGFKFNALVFCCATSFLAVVRCLPFNDRPATDANVGYFWHVTDMHWDPSYAAADSSGPGVSCGADAPPSGELGVYGDYACDSPWKLINDSIYAMKDIRADVDFVIWTGDDTPHNADISSPEVAAIIGNLTDKIRECFPATQAYPVLGNHDWSPKHQLPPRPDPQYDTVADLWAPWLRDVDPQADASFRQSGFYTTRINADLQLIGLNTNLYYTNDDVTEGMPDPGCQFQWFDDVLTSARTNNTKVIVIGHVPPGQFEKHNNTYWFRPFFNQVFHELLRKHSDIIGSAHFAHHHTDSFRLINHVNGSAATSLLIAPSVTPWETTLPGVMGGAGNNPSVRLVRYDRQTGAVLDIDQYYLDLVAANADGSSNWTLAYRFTEHFALDDVSTASLATLAEALWTDDGQFSRYYAINDLYYEDATAWTHQERLVHCCAIRNVDYANYADCLLANHSSAPSPPVAGGGATVQRSAAILALVVFALLPVA